MKINTGAEYISSAIRHLDKNLGNIRSQLASGLQNPDPSTDPLTSTIAKELSADVVASQTVQNITLTAKSTVEIASGILQSNLKILHNMKILAVKASSSTFNDGNRGDMDIEFQQLIGQIDDNAQSQWGSRILFDGTFAANYQIDLQATKVINVTFSDMTAATVIGAMDVTTLDHAKQALTDLETSLDTVLNELIRLGSYSQQFESLTEQMELNTQNLQGTLSIHNDVDFSEAIIDSNRLSVLRDAANATLKMQFSDFEKLGNLVKESLGR